MTKNSQQAKIPKKMSNYKYDSYSNRTNYVNSTPTDNISQDLRELYEDDLRFRRQQQSQVLPAPTSSLPPPAPVALRKPTMNYQGAFLSNCYTLGRSFTIR